MSPTIRRATPEDLAAVADIYAHAVAHSIATFDTERPAMAVWQARLDSTEAGDAFLVAVDADRVVGFAYSSAYRARPAYHRTRETTVYVADGMHGRGIGTSLYGELLGLMGSAGVHVAIAAIAVPNDPSERLHVAAGFEKVGHLTEVGDKFERWIDVAIYQRLF